MDTALSHFELDIWRKPVQINFWSLDWKRAEAFLKEFVARIPQRIDALQRNVRCSAGFEQWSADYSDESFLPLGRWIRQVGRVQEVASDDVHVVALNPKLHEEAAEIMREAAKQDPAAELTEETHALAVDIGIYCGEAVRRRFPSLRWRRCKAKCSDNQNYPLLEQETNNGPNPIDDMYYFTLAVLENRMGDDQYYRTLQIWLRGAEVTEGDRQRKTAKARSDVERKRSDR